MPVIRLEEGERALELMRWGLVPFWAEDLKIGTKLLNARSETALEKPAFREAMRRRRCLVPASGFYEWTTIDGKKQPFHIVRRDGRPLAFAGLWEQWRGPDGPLRSYTILTTGPNEIMEPIHNRMPVILDGEVAARWLDVSTPAEKALQPAPSGTLEAFPVNRAIGRVGFEGPACLERVHWE
jgi:putative SOS response-associated peptidase YedK